MSDSPSAAKSPDRWRAALAVPAYVILFWIAISLPGWLRYAHGGFLPRSIPTHSWMLLASIGLTLLVDRRWRERLGFIRGTFRFSPWMFLWALPTALLAVLSTLTGPRGAASHDPLAMSPLRTILFVWIYASFAEEIFARGLLQGWLAAASSRGVRLFRRWFIGLPVWVSAVLFGLSHLVLWPMIGPIAIPICGSAALLGVVAGYHRQQTGSLLPAILVHALFNVGGTLPVWLLRG